MKKQEGENRMAKISDINEIYNNANMRLEESVQPQHLIVYDNINANAEAVMQMGGILDGFGNSLGIFDAFNRQLVAMEPAIWGIVAALMAFKAAEIGLAVASNALSIANIIAANSHKALKYAMQGMGIFMIVTAVIALVAAMGAWINKTIGIKAAWLIACNAVKTAVEEMAYALKERFLMVELFFLGLKTAIFGIAQGIANTFIDLYNKAAEVISFLTGTNIQMKAHVDWGNQAQNELDARKLAGEQQLANYRTEIDNNQAGRWQEINNTIAEHEAKRNTAEQPATQQNMINNNMNTQQIPQQYAAIQAGQIQGTGVYGAMTAAGGSLSDEKLIMLSEDVKALRENVSGYFENKKPEIVNHNKINMTNNNTIRETLDIRKTAKKLADMLVEEYNSGMEGIAE